MLLDHILLNLFKTLLPSTYSLQEILMHKSKELVEKKRKVVVMMMMMMTVMMLKRRRMMMMMMM